MKLSEKILLLITVLIMLLSGCSRREKFVLESNLEKAITELALKYDTFDMSSTKEDSYPAIFIRSFCQNSRLTFDYLENTCEESDGFLTRKQVEYIQYSLTGENVDFAEYVGEEGIDAYQTTSGLDHGEIVSYEAEIVDEQVYLVAQYEFRNNAGSDRPSKVFELEAILEKNDESCFDGYSIKSISKKDKTPVITGDDKEHIFCGIDMGIEENGVFIFECFGGEDDVIYGTHVKVDFSEKPVLAEFVRENKEKEFEVTYIWNSTVAEPIEYVTPPEINVIMDATEEIENNETDELKPDKYVGAYNSYDVNEPDLQIQKNEGGTYLIQIGIYRLVQLDACIGRVNEDKIVFSTTEWGEDKEINGTITVDDEDIATVTLEAAWSDWWFKNINVYKYYKVSDTPDIYELQY